MRLGVADDEQIFHSLIERSAATCGTDVEVLNFFDTDSLKDYLFENPGTLDALFLDVRFDGGESGIEALPEIREYDPTLIVYLLTFEDNVEVITEAVPYKVTYLKKPVTEKELHIHIKGMLLQRDSVKDLCAHISNLYKEKQVYDSLLAEVVPEDIKFIIGNIFDDIEFSPKALKVLCDNVDDPRLLKLLKSIDWKTDPPAGAQPKPFESLKKLNVWEYRIDKKARVFVQRRKDSKPCIYDIDYTHRHDG